MKIYISMPITGHDYETQRRKAEQIATTMELAGHEPVNPFKVAAAPSWMDDEKEKYAYYMGEDIRELILCEGIYLAQGWEDSKGCQLENAAAQIYGLKEFTTITMIPGLEDL